MKHIYLVRHCKASGQHPSAPLTEEGVRQSEALADFFNRSIQQIMRAVYEDGDRCLISQ